VRHIPEGAEVVPRGCEETIEKAGEKPMEKQELRQRILMARTMMDPRDLKTYSALISNKLLSLDRVKDAECIMAYYSYKNEPDLKDFIQTCLDMGKRAALPYVAGEGEMIAVRFESDSVMKSNIYGIPEPVLTNDTEEEKPDVVIAPGIAFDRNMYRVGFGRNAFGQTVERDI
jgi:5-formyltetrahydrofolate cyclo-ligase